MSKINEYKYPPEYYKTHLFPEEVMAGGHIYGCLEDYTIAYNNNIKKSNMNSIQEYKEKSKDKHLESLTVQEKMNKYYADQDYFAGFDACMDLRIGYEFALYRDNKCHQNPDSNYWFINREEEKGGYTLSELYDYYIENIFQP